MISKEIESLIDEQYKKRKICVTLKSKLQAVVKAYLKEHPNYGMSFYEVIQGIAEGVGKEEWKKQHVKPMEEMRKAGSQSPKAK